MKQRSRDLSAALVDGIIRFVASGGMLTTALLAPNAVQLFDKPLMQLFDSMDKRAQQRELRRIMHYMKSRGLIKYDPKDYEHGIVLTKEGKKRLKRIDFSDIAIEKPKSWDGRWRAVFFDIPESEKNKRNLLNKKLHQLGFKQLQFSILIHPFPCREEIEVVCEYLGVRKYVSYVELVHIDSEKVLKKQFKHLLS